MAGINDNWNWDGLGTWLERLVESRFGRRGAGKDTGSDLVGARECGGEIRRLVWGFNLRPGVVTDTMEGVIVLEVK